MATAQKRGFRFPWGGDSRREHDTPDHGRDEPSLAERLGVVQEDLGRGPFDLATTAEPAEGVVAEDAAPGDVAPAEDLAVGEDTAAPDAAVPAAGVDTPADAAAAADAPAPDGQAAAEAVAQPVEASSSATVDPAIPDDPAPVTVGADDAPAATSGAGAWPEADRRTKRPAAAAKPAVVLAARPNPLMAGLVRAMRDAAQAAREESVAILRAEATRRSEQIRSETTALAAELRRGADSDVAAIREWSKAEIARIREETEARIAGRRQQLVEDVDAQAQTSDALLGRMADAVQAYEAMTAAFFDALLAEDDPARLAGLAERLPTAPTLEEFQLEHAPAGAGDLAAATETVTESSSEAPARTSRAKRAATPSEPAPADASSADPIEAMAAVEPMAAVEAGADGAADGATGPADAGGADPADPAIEPLALDAAAAAAAEAEALAGLDGQTQLIVSGLSSVASIATFKAGLMRSEGVTAISVTAGTDGDCLFTVTHGPEIDLRRALREVEPFETRIIADDGSSLVVVAHEPAA
jgi:hypothetical protein